MTAGRLAGMRTLLTLLIGFLVTACSSTGASVSPATVVTSAPQSDGSADPHPESDPRASPLSQPDIGALADGHARAVVRGLRPADLA